MEPWGTPGFTSAYDVTYSHTSIIRGSRGYQVLELKTAYNRGPRITEVTSFSSQNCIINVTRVFYYQYMHIVVSNSMVIMEWCQGL